MHICIKKRSILIPLLLAAVLPVLAGVALPAAAVPQEMKTSSAKSLPAPYSQWDVTLEPVARNGQVLALEFDSPVLKRRTRSTIFVPDSYQKQGAPSPVMYYLHGTVVPALDNPLLNPVTGLGYFTNMVAAGGGKTQTELFQFASMLDKANFLVVAPDTNTKRSWCDNCAWIDGRDDLLPNAPPVTGETVPADSYLHQELYPLIEELFNARTDRGGRGVMGFSMGGWAALTQAMKHPDKYTYVGSVSGVYDIFAPLVRVQYAEPIGYMRDQGYGTSVTHETWWRNFNPGDLVENIRGIDNHMLLSSGTGCLSLDSLRHPDCRTDPPINILAREVEKSLLQNYKRAVNSLAKKGIPAQTVKLPGVHGSNNHRVYSEYIVPSANRVFASEAQMPESFQYRTVNPRFSVWGYDVAVDRTKPSFLRMSEARTDGRSFTVSGVGKVTITTPDAFEPGHSYEVTVASKNKRTQRTVTAGEHGRLQVEFNLTHRRPVTVKIA